MTIRVIIQFADDNLFILIFYYELYKLHIDILFHTKILMFQLRRISSVNYWLGHVIEHIAVRQ